MNDNLATRPGDAARRVMRRVERAALATSLDGGDGWPYASLVMVACDHDASPLLMVSNLAEHTKNIAREPRVSLLFDGTAELDDPLTGARVTVLGRIAKTDAEIHRRRFLARHPSAGIYADFTDFSVYCVTVERAHLVAGFGDIHWIDAGELMFDTAASGALIAAEPEIVAHVNSDHAATVDLYAHALLNCNGDGWLLTGVDPEGADLRSEGSTARLDFPSPVHDADDARTALINLAERARSTK